MSVNNGIISKPIGVAEVAQVLNAGDCYDLGTLCTHPHVNVNSLHKPISYPKIAELTEAEYQSANYGYVPYVLSTSDYENFSSKLVNGQIQQWAYNRPTGEASSPYRLSDFVGYDKDAVSPFRFEIEGDVRIDGNLRLNFPNGFYSLYFWERFGGHMVGGVWTPASQFPYGLSVIVPGVGVYAISVPASSSVLLPTTDDLDESKINAVIPDDSTFQAGRTYQCYLAFSTFEPRSPRQWVYFTDAMSARVNNNWLILPGEPQSFTVLERYNPLNSISIGLTGTFRLTPNAEDVNIGNYRAIDNIVMDIEASNLPSGTVVAKVKARAVSITSSSVTPYDVELAQFNLTSGTVRRTYNNQINAVVRDDDYKFRVSVELEMTYSGTHYDRYVGDYELDCINEP